MRPIVLAAALAAALPLGATRAAAQQHADHQPPKVSKDAPGGLEALGEPSQAADAEGYEF